MCVLCLKIIVYREIMNFGVVLCFEDLYFMFTMLAKSEFIMKIIVSKTTHHVECKFFFGVYNITLIFIFLIYIILN